MASSASIYFRKFYLKNCFCEVDPRLVFVGCLYLASKTEESVVAAKTLAVYVRKNRPTWSYDLKHILDIEMVSPFTVTMGAGNIVLLHGMAWHSQRVGGGGCSIMP